MRKRKVPESALDELMPVDDLSGMALYFGILRAVGKGIGTFVKDEFEAHRYLDHQFVRDSFNFTTCMVALAPISAVAALWFVPRLIAIALRKVRRPGYYEREKARRQALAHERLSTRRRTTLNPIPTPEALLAQFRRIRRNPREMLIFGSMLEDLEAYVDNSLVRDPDGTIVGRKGGIKQWLWENCAELGKRYHTVMRYKALAKRFKQAIDLEDPIPVAYALTSAVEALSEVIADRSGDGDVGSAEDMQLRYGPNSCGARDATQGAMRETGREGKMQLRCGQKLVEARSKAEALLEGCQDTKKDLDEMLAMLLEPDRTPASPRGGFPGRGKRILRPQTGCARVLA